ncbi:MAG: lysylphosphatidylglycerol synthase transmembrane domain-containing protein [Pseudomonadota bacterium]
MVEKAKSKSSIIYKFIFGILISLCFLYLFFKDLKFDKILSILARLNYIHYLWIALILILTNVIRAYRWQFILRPIKKISLLSSFSNISIGQMANNLLPARLGELFRIGSLAKIEKIKTGSLLSALILERLFDGYFLLVFLILSFWLLDFSSQSNILVLLKNGTLAAFVLYSVVGLSLVCIIKFKLESFFKRFVPEKLSFIFYKINDFREGMKNLLSFSSFSILLFYTAFIWGLMTFCMYGTFYLFISIDPNIFSKVSCLDCMFYIGALGLASLIPSAPGYFGTFHYVGMLSLVSIGLEKNFADTFAIFSHGSQYILLTFIGLIFFWKEHLKVRELLE